MYLAPIYGPDSLTLRASLLGDIQLDGFVNGLDINIVGGQFGLFPGGGAALINGDVNGDGFVNGLDINVISSQFGASLGATTAVPEPSGFALAAVATSLLLVQWRKRTSAV